TVDLDERTVPAGPVVVDDPGQLALARARLACEQHTDLERRDERHLAERRGEGRASPDHPFEADRPAQGTRGVRVVLLAPPGEEALRQRRQVAGEELGVRAVFLGERSSLLAALEVEHAE